MTYTPPSSEHADRYVRFVIARRRVEEARRRVWRWERRARVASFLMGAWLVLAVASVVRADWSLRYALTLGAIGGLAAKEWLEWMRKVRKARRLVARREARLWDE